MGFWKHNKKYHCKTTINEDKLFCCKFCNKKLSCKQSKWRHEKTCGLSNKITLKDQIYKILEENKDIKHIKQIKTKSNTINSTTNNSNNNSNNTTNNTNIQYIINSPTNNSLTHLTFEIQKEILDKDLNSLIYLIEQVNFNKSVPENHSYCVTAINDKHATVIDDKTNTVIKTNKFDLFDKVLGANLSILDKLANNQQFTTKEQETYKKRINYLRTSIFENNNFMKRYKNDINLISYNNKELIKDTWKNLKPVECKTNEENNDEDEEEEYYGDKPKGFDDLIEKLPEHKKPDFLKKKVNNKESDTKSEDKIKNKQKTNPKSKSIINIRTDSSNSETDSEITSESEKNYKQIINPRSKSIIKIRSESSSEESDAKTIDSELDEKSYDLPEIKIKGKTYLLEGLNLYIKNKNETKGELYGTWNASNNKVIKK
jgi:hypothetical protein